MRKMKRFTALFLAALMLCTLIGARPAQAADMYTLQVSVEVGQGAVTINGEPVYSKNLEAGTKVTVRITPVSESDVLALYLPGSEVSFKDFPDLSASDVDPDDWTKGTILTFTMPEKNAGLELYFVKKAQDFGSKTLNLTKGQVKVSGEKEYMATAGFLTAALQGKTPLIRGDHDISSHMLDLDRNGSWDVSLYYNYEERVLWFFRMDSCSLGDRAEVTLTKEAAAALYGFMMEETKDYYSTLVFVFAPSSVEKAAVTVKDQIYTGKALTPAPTVKLDGVTLKKNEDYTVTYKNNTNAGTATVTVKGKAPYYNGSVSKTFTIKPAPISKATVGALAAKTYTGAAIKPAPTVKFGGKTLVKGTDYSVAYKNNTNAGTATVTITGKGNFTGTVNKIFTIKPASLKAAKISGLKDMLYTGKAITQTPVVKLGTRTLKAGTDYTVKYAQNTNVGTATVTFTGKGNYVGSAQATFKIMDPVEEFVARLYRVCLDREPEAQGHAWWVARLRAKQETGGSCAWGFFDSTEFKNHKYNNSAFLDHAYQAFFDRKADTAGKNYWLGEMKKGMSRKQVIAGFAASNEWAALCKTYGIKP